MNSCSLEKELRRYYRAVRRRLICPRALRRQTLENLQSNVAEYLESHPGATMADVEAHFGTAESLVVTMGPAVEDSRMPIDES